MTLFLPLFLLLLCLNDDGCSLVIAQSTPTTPVHILTNARVYTVNDASPWAEAIAIQGGMIVAVGTSAEVQASYPNAQKVTDMGGRLVLPGFQDVHLHAVEAGINEGICVFDGDAPIADLPFYFDDCPDGGLFGDQGWIVGGGIDIGGVIETLAFDPNSDVPLTVLDREFPNTPVVILDQFGHGAIANTVALRAVGYDTLPGDPPGGIIDRDPETGDLTGIVLENAQQRLRDMVFPPTAPNQAIAYDALLAALEILKSNGITSVSDAGGFWRQAQTETWGKAEADGLLTVRASNALYVYPDIPMTEQLPELQKRFTNDPSKLVRFNQAKIYVDGILSLATSAMYSPYETGSAYSETYQRGLEYFGDSATLNSVSTMLATNGFQIHYHVTGDRGTGLALDAIGQIRSANISNERHRLTHCFLVDQTDRQRFAQLNAVADFQVTPSSVNPMNIENIAGNIGVFRSSQLIPAVEVMEAGAFLTLSSDWDADALSPLVKIKTVLTRPTGRPFADVATVIPFLTKNPATLLGTNTGSIEVGKAADIIALDKNIFEIAPDTIDQAKVVLTIFNGDVIYDPTGITGTPVTIAPTPAPSGGGGGGGSGGGSGATNGRTTTYVPLLLTLILAVTLSVIPNLCHTPYI